MLFLTPPVTQLELNWITCESFTLITELLLLVTANTTHDKMSQQMVVNCQNCIIVKSKIQNMHVVQILYKD